MIYFFSTYRYRFDLKVDDHKNSATFNVFDKAAQEFFKISCSNMILSQGTVRLYGNDLTYRMNFHICWITYFQSSCTDIFLRLLWS
jgi:hypothetical protein